MMKQPTILCVGHACIDHNISEHAHYEGWGSSVLYMSQHYKKQYGVQATAVTTYGPDLLPYVKGFNLFPKHPNARRTLIYENDSTGEHRVQHCHNLAEAVPPDMTEKLEKLIGQADIIIVSPLLPNYDASYVADLLTSTAKGCVKVLCPQGYFRSVDVSGLVSPMDFAEAEMIVPQFDLVIFSEEDHPRAMQVAQEWKRTAPDTHIVVTEGPHGASIVTSDGSHNIPTTPIAPEDVVDSVGCGDIFAAAVALALYSTRDIESAIMEGHGAAGQKLLAVEALVQ